MKKSEILLYGVGVGYFDPFSSEASEKAEIITALKGFKDFHIIKSKGVILLFSARGYAEKAIRKLEKCGIHTGGKVGEFSVSKDFLKSYKVGLN